ncbi:MAG: Amidohydrolase family protein [Candidatus Udaeobacter sp.]|nr:MAG: Amidohydrolase family protein [Candidatus Udaeobacter sp.]
MRMSTPFVGTNDYGILTMTQDQIHEAVDEAHAHNFQVGVHANGDVTIDMVLKAYERASKVARSQSPSSYRALHAGESDLIRRIKASGVIPTPFWTYVYYHGEKWTQWRRQGGVDVRAPFVPRRRHPGPGRLRLHAGPFEPLMAIQSMVTRKDYKGRVWGAVQKVTVDEALTIATINGAYLVGRAPEGIDHGR